MSEPRYSEQELSEILRDAAERSTADLPPYSLMDIQRIAEPADIAPEHVAQAAAALPFTAGERPTLLFGEASATHLVRRINRLASPGEMMDAVTILRQRLRHSGVVRDVGGGLEWRYDSGYSNAVVSIVPDANGTIVRVEGRADGRQFIVHFGAVAAAVLTGFVATTATTPTFSALTAAVALVPYAAVGRLWWNRSARAAARRLSALADELAARLHRS
jgi:hypothetical protein